MHRAQPLGLILFFFQHTSSLGTDGTLKHCMPMSNGFLKIHISPANDKSGGQEQEEEKTTQTEYMVRKGNQNRV